MSIPYDYDPSNVEHLRAVIDEQEQTIKYLHERCKAEEVENVKLRELVRFALLRCNADNPMCDACTDGYDGVCELEQRMFELGVEP